VQYRFTPRAADVGIRERAPRRVRVAPVLPSWTPQLQQEARGAARGCTAGASGRPGELSRWEGYTGIWQVWWQRPQPPSSANSGGTKEAF